MTNKQKVIKYCRDYISRCDYNHYTNCENNKSEIEKDQIDYYGLEGCPQSYGLDEVEELCEIDLDGYTCAKCWENALSVVQE